MNTVQTVKGLRNLRLNAMANYYEASCKQSFKEAVNAHQLIAQMVEEETIGRTNRRTEVLLKKSKMRYRALLSDINYAIERGLKEDVVQLISEGHYLQQANNIVITGATGCGKSYLACAFGRQACLQGHQVLYLNHNKLNEQLMTAKIEGGLTKLIGQITSPKLLIIDDFGLSPLTAETRLALLHIFEDRYGEKSTLIASQIPTANWYDYINEPTIADAILDRLTSRAIKIELKGASLRQKLN